MALFKHERLFCPVCDAHLGDRAKNELFMGHCDECKASFIWKPNAKKPESSLDKDKPKVCGCKNCGR